MKRTLIILFLVLLVVGCLFAIAHFTGLPCPWFEEPPTNLLIIVSDALRDDVPGCYGGPARTPNIDRLARTGTLFEKWYSTSPWTLPSSVVMFTGNFPTTYGRKEVARTIGQTGNKKKTRMVYHVPDEETLLSEALLEKWYDLKMVLENSLPSQSNNLQGFEKLKLRKGTTEERQHVGAITGLPETAFKHLFTFLEYLLDRESGQPFGALVWILDPHDKYSPPKRLSEGIEVDEDRLSREKRLFPLYSSRHLTELGLSFNEDDRRYLKDLYIAELESVNQRVGYILEALEHKGLLDGTLIVFTSDHGECFGEHGFFTHGHNYHEEVMRVPMIITGPGVPAGRRIPETCSHLGLMPTLKDLLGLSFTADFQGRSSAAADPGRTSGSGTAIFRRLTPQALR